MKPLFEMPELLSLSGVNFAGDPEEGEGGNTCRVGCASGCESGCSAGQGIDPE